MNFDFVINPANLANLKSKPQLGEYRLLINRKMIKNLFNYFAIPLGITAFIFIALSTNQKVVLEADPADYSTEGLDLHFTVSEDMALADFDAMEEAFDFHETSYSPYLGKSYLGFKEAIGFKESRGNYFTVNTLGYLGKYQFGAETLKLIGIHNPEYFLYNPKLQEKAFEANASRNKWILRKDILKYVGKTVGNIMVTESGILAAAHLAGPGSVMKFLRSAGGNDVADAYGTTITSYMKKFSGYDTTSIIPDKQAKAVL
ncbi:hypothetical protein SAMN03097699_1343 [Flavobacteriaceae bacterium MAR_2010_188]|nr:hypothetical protein SAMN03097699_1343 [Flavobacteriaceae bacterium MAR_2010_188]